MFQLPPWAQSFIAACMTVGTIIGGFFFLRSGARKAIEKATEEAIARKTAAETAASAAQSQELGTLRMQVGEFKVKVDQLSAQITAQSTLITGYVNALQEKDFVIAKLSREKRDLESQLERKHR